MENEKSTCSKCPVWGCDTTYRSSRCAALRDQYGLGDPKTYLDALRELDALGMAKWIANFVLDCAYECTGKTHHLEEGFVEQVAEYLQCPIETDGECEDILYPVNKEEEL